MTIYVCSKCGAEATSKCIRQRNTFMRDQHIALYETLLWPKEINQGEEVTLLTFKSYWTGVPDGQILADFFDTIRKAPEDVLKAVCCEHDLRPTTVCMFGCCVPDEQVQTEEVEI